MSSDSIFDSLIPQLPWISSSSCVRLMTTLLHSLWQASLIAVAFGVVDFGLRRSSANARYWSGVLSLSMIVLCAVMTFGLLSTIAEGSANKVASRSSSSAASATTVTVTGALSSSNGMPTAEMSAATSGTRLSVPLTFHLVSAAPWLTAAYLIGVGVMFFRLAVAVIAGWRIRLVSVEIVDERIKEIVHRTAERWAVRVVPIVAYCHRVAVPVVTGTLRPMILIPPALMSGLTIGQLELILAHEMAHLRRGDLLINWLQRVVEAIFFFHPAVWYISYRVNLERECTCDDWVVASGWPAFEYAEALMGLANICGARRMRGVQAAALLAATGKRPSQLKYRLLRLLGEPVPSLNRPNFGGMTVTALVFVLAALVLWDPSEGQSSDSGNQGGAAEVTVAIEVAQVNENETASSEPVHVSADDEPGAKSQADDERSLMTDSDVVTKVIIEGNTTIPDAEIAKHIKTRPGRLATQKQIKNDVDGLMRTRWFVSVEPKLHPSDEGLILAFRVIERPIVRRVEYKGLKKVKQKVFDAMTQLRPGSPFDIRSNRESARRIEEFYHEKGFTFATVDLEKGNDRDDREVVFLINEGPKVHVTAVKFEGNQEFVDGILKTKARTKTRILQLFGGKYDPSTIKEDLEGVKQYYHSLGYFDVVIEESLKFSDDKGNLEIHYEIDEGPRYKIRNIEIDGNKVMSEDVLRDMMKVHGGIPYNARDIQKDVELIRTKYGELGRLFSRVDAVPKFTDEGGIVDLEYKIDEDRVYRVRNINVHIMGDHPHTRTNTARNISPVHPGDLADPKQIHLIKRRLEGSQERSGLKTD